MSNTYSWYSQLKKPKFAPPAWIFGPVWTMLYILIFISFGYVAYIFYKGAIPFIVILPFIINLIANFIFVPIQFGLKNNILALIDILIVLATIIWLMVSIFPYVSWVVYANIPYLIWVAFATILQISVTWMNRSK